MPRSGSQDVLKQRLNADLTYPAERENDYKRSSCSNGMRNGSLASQNSTVACWRCTTEGVATLSQATDFTDHFQQTQDPRQLARLILVAEQLPCISFFVHQTHLMFALPVC